MGKPSDLLRADRYKFWGPRPSHPSSSTAAAGDSILPIHSVDGTSSDKTSKSGGLNENVGTHARPEQNGRSIASGPGLGDVTWGGDAPRPAVRAQNSDDDGAPDATPPDAPPPAPPPHMSGDARTGDSSIDSGQGQSAAKTSITTRMAAGCQRFVRHTREALFTNWVNLLLVFVPIGIAVKAIGLNPDLVFAMNAIAIIPLAGMLALATEVVASKLGDTWGALLNVSFGNAVELIIFIIALVKNEISIVQSSLLGSILANLLLILGMAFLFGGLRFQEQIYNTTVTQMSACLLSLSVVSLLLPTAFHASFNAGSAGPANSQVLKMSRGTSVVLLLVYILYLLFQLKSHAYLYESTPQAVIDEESHPGVFADIMNSSSSSDTSSSDNSDTDASGSVHAAGKRIKRAFKNRRRRKSTASASASSTTGSAVTPALSSPSTTERPTNNYWESQISSALGSSLESHPEKIASGDEADADEAAHAHTIDGPRVRDFGGHTPPSNEAKPPKRSKRSKKRNRKHQRKNHRDVEKSAANNCSGGNGADPEKAQAEHSTTEAPRVAFAPDAQLVDSTTSDQAPTKPAFNMRQLGARSVLFRPALPKMLSNNVFVTQPPLPGSTARPAPSRSASSATVLRRTNSLPDRLISRSVSDTPRPAPRSTPLPPYHHQARRFQMNRVASIEQQEATADYVGDDDADSVNEPQMTRTSAVVLLLISTALVAVCAEFMVDAIPPMIASSNISQAFIGLIVLPIVGNAAEHVTAVTVATKNKMDLAIGVAVGSSIQIALFVTPLIVLLGWILGRDMSLYFNLFDTISLFATAFVVNFLVLDGRSNYLEGALLIAAYVIIALGAFFYPTRNQQSQIGGVGST